MDKTEIEQLSSLDKNELMKLLVQRNAHIQQLQNLLKRSNSKNFERGVKPSRPFDFNRFKKRHVALKLFYLGWDYHGFVTQEGELNTIEEHLFDALMKTKLIESRQTSNYHRCGRTDKGVSAFSQVISLDVRSRVQDGLGVFEPAGYTGEQNNSKAETSEIEYVSLLNRVLPNNIQAIAWAPVKQDFSARFSCTKRVYKYYFPAGDLNLEKMQKAAMFLEGEHDFRNLCKMDIGGGVTVFLRNIHSVSVKQMLDGPQNGYTLCELTVEGNAFLWHQIRCIMGVLYLIGKGNEEPEIIKQLLDVEDNPCKPQYSMAADFPLVLFDCEYESLDWQYDHDALETVLQKLQKQWTHASIKSTMIKQLINSIESFPVVPALQVTQQDSEIIMGIKSKVYKPLLERPKCESLEERLQRVKRKKLEVEENIDAINDEQREVLV